jgi:hypothetical protein
MEFGIEIEEENRGPEPSKLRERMKRKNFFSTLFPRCTLS